MRRILMPLAALAMLSCANVTVDEPSICDSKSLSQLPSVPVGVTPPPGISTPPISFSQTLDLSSTLSKINNVADSVNITVNDLMLDNSSGAMSWVSDIEVDITAQGMPSRVLTKYTLTSSDQSSTSLSLPVSMDSSTLYSYLSSGPVTLTFTFSGGVPSQTPELTGSMCVSASANKHLSL